MLVSTKGRYALRVMIDMAEHQEKTGFIALKDVAERQDISIKYLENIMKSLVKAKLVEGTRGKGGGYRLTKRPSSIKASAIITATEGTIAPVACLEKKRNNCERAATCKTLAMWKGLQDNITGFLDGFTLQDLVEGAGDVLLSEEETPEEE